MARPHPDLSFDALLAAAAAPLRITLFRETTPTDVADRARYLATMAEPAVAGSVFGGEREALAGLAAWFDREVNESLATGHPALEEVLLGAVVAEHRAAFMVSYASHASILENLLGPRTDSWVALRALASCRDRGLHEEGLAVARELEEAWRSGALQLSWREVGRLHSDGAAIAWDAGRYDVAARAQTRLAELVEQTPTADGGRPAAARPAPRSTVALCMIVRDEAAVIERCLDSVRELIDTWVIVDTGSSDDTRERITRALDGIPGRLHQRAWRDFAHNRTELMRLARGAADYLLLLDADMTLEQRGALPELRADSYLVRHAGSLDYAIPRLVRGDRAWHYVGATHEYLASDGEHTQAALATLRVVHHGDGSSHAVKLERDRSLLERELADRPDDARTLFYLARTYADLGDQGRAIALLRRRVAVGGWDEEVFYAQFQLGTLLADTDWGAAAEALLDAWRRRPARAEPLYALARGWRVRGRHDLAAQYATQGLDIPYPDDILFVHRDPYHWGLRFERALAACSLGDAETALTDIDAVLRDGVPADVEPWVHQTRSSCLDQLGLEERPVEAPPARGGSGPTRVPYLHELVPAVRLTLVAIPTLEPWPSLNPSVAAARDGALRMIVRTANYRLHDGGYRFLDSDGVVRTRNYLVDLDSALEITGVKPLPMVPGSDLRAGPVVGLEDARLVELSDRWVVSATVRDRNDEWRCEMALFEVDGAPGSPLLRVLPSPSGARHEKNWMPVTRDDSLFFVYSLGPTVVLRCEPNAGALEEVARSDAPAWASELRGGSQGLRVSDGHVFVAHEVGWSDRGREYLHRLVHLNDDWVLDAASPRFRFVGPGIEFCAGLAPVDGDLVLSFGAQDRAAYLARVPAAALLALLEPIGA